MFSSCARCGTHFNQTPPRIHGGVLSCASCSTEYRFAPRPLLWITGTPGVGKTATAGLLANRLRDCVVADMDFFTQPELDTDSSRMMLFYRSWLRLASAIASGGGQPIVAGFVRPGELESVPERDLFTGIHFLALTCAPETLTARMRDRQLAGTLPEGDFEGLHALNNWFRSLASAPSNVTLLDTTQLTVDEAAASAAQWARTALARA